MYSRLFRISRFMSQAKGLNQQAMHIHSPNTTSAECICRAWVSSCTSTSANSSSVCDSGWRSNGKRRMDRLLYSGHIYVHLVFALLYIVSLNGWYWLAVLWNEWRRGLLHTDKSPLATWALCLANWYRRLSSLHQIQFSEAVSWHKGRPLLP